MLHVMKPIAGAELENEPPERQDDRVGLVEVLLFLRRHSGRLFLGAMLGAALGVVYLLFAEPVYTASAKLLLEPQKPYFQGQPAPIVPTVDSAQIESEIQILRSEQIVRTVIDTLGLSSDPEFGRSRSSALERIFAQGQAAVSAQADAVIGAFKHGAPTEAGTGANAGASSQAPDEAPAKDTLERDPVVPVLAAFDSRMGARRLGLSYVIEISFWSTDPAKAAKVTNAIAAAYIRDQLEGKLRGAEQGSEFREGPIVALRKRIDAAASSIQSGVLEVGAFPAGDARVITAASIPLGKSWPKRGLTMAVSVLLGLAAGLCAGMFSDALRRVSRVRS